MLRAVLFDVDGTLLDTVDYHAEAWHRTFRHFGHEIPAADIRPQIGKGGDQLLPVFLPPDEVERSGEAMGKFRSDLFQREFLPHVRPFPGVRELFLRLAADGRRLVLASSASPEELKKFADIAGVSDLVMGGTSSGDVERSKPHPDIFHAALKKAGVAPNEAIAVGDTPYDAEAASKAGIATVGMLCGGFPEQDLRSAGCVAIYRDPEELLREYERSLFGL